jgi:catechol 2,3-dioxygenase-like lactoylglutathione lyase family enzyme
MYLRYSEPDSKEVAIMMKFDHLTIPVTHLARSRAWPIETLGLTVEFEVPDQRTVALQDSEGFTIFLRQAGSPVEPKGCALYFQVTDVDATFAVWSGRDVRFSHPPRKTYWGYGAELEDPDGYLIRLWDERSMKEK